MFNNRIEFQSWIMSLSWWCAFFFISSVARSKVWSCSLLWNDDFMVALVSISRNNQIKINAIINIKCDFLLNAWENGVFAIIYLNALIYRMNCKIAVIVIHSLFYRIFFSFVMSITIVYTIAKYPVLYCSAKLSLIFFSTMNSISGLFIFYVFFLFCLTFEWIIITLDALEKKNKILVLFARSSNERALKQIPNKCITFSCHFTINK